MCKNVENLLFLWYDFLYKKYFFFENIRKPKIEKDNDRIEQCFLSLGDMLIGGWFAA